MLGDSLNVWRVSCRSLLAVESPSEGASNTKRNGLHHSRRALCHMPCRAFVVLPAEDVLSALDSHVASHICSKLLRGPLLAITLAREVHSL